MSKKGSWFQLRSWVEARFRRGNLTSLREEKQLSEKEWEVLEWLCENQAVWCGYPKYSIEALGYDTLPILRSLREKGLLEEWF